MSCQEGEEGACGDDTVQFRIREWLEGWVVGAGIWITESWSMGRNACDLSLNGFC